MTASLQNPMNISHFHFICNLWCSGVCIAEYDSVQFICLCVCVYVPFGGISVLQCFHPSSEIYIFSRNRAN